MAYLEDMTCSEKFDAMFFQPIDILFQLWMNACYIAASVKLSITWVNIFAIGLFEVFFFFSLAWMKQFKSHHPSNVMAIVVINTLV